MNTNWKNAKAPTLSARQWLSLISDIRAVDTIDYTKESERFNLAHKRKVEACDQLREALITAPWGQNGAAFVTVRSNFPGGSGQTRTLWINRKEVAWIDTSEGWVVLIDPATAQQNRLAFKRRARKKQELYLAERDLLIQELVASGHDTFASFGQWRFEDGQKGGTFFRTSLIPNYICVAAESAMQAADTLRPCVPTLSDEDFDDEFGGRRPMRVRHLGV